ncbi:MAG: TRAP transporter large permease [Acetobacteraceae bacterium]|nr:TRAP transporter large permease [Acetobacteraceae bacterium]
MSLELAGVAGILALLVLLALRMPVGIAMMAVGTAGIALLANERAALATLANEAIAITTKTELLVIPLFILMGNLATASGLSRNLYDAAYAWVGARRGGLASATVLGCAGFSALCGSSVASAVTVGRVALPEMRRHGYNPGLATGTVAAGGTLGILIPPSAGFVVYAILTEQSIGQLFIAGILPGLLLTGLFVLTVWLLVSRDPSLGPPGPRLPRAERMAALAGAGPILFVMVGTIGGIYAGMFTPMEAAAVGAVLTLLIALARRGLTAPAAREVLTETARTTAMIYVILVGAHVFGPFLARTGLPGALSDWMIGLGLGPYGTLALILLVLIVLGCFLEGFAMLVLTLPILFPTVVALGFDPIWFGVVMVIVLEMGLITPPVGVNVFVVKSIAPDVPLARMFRGVLPFWGAMMVCVLLLVAFPGIATVLPQTMFGR